MDLTAAAWLVEGAEVERELDDIGDLERLKPGNPRPF